MKTRKSQRGAWAGRLLRLGVCAAALSLWTGVAVGQAQEKGGREQEKRQKTDPDKSAKDKADKDKADKDRGGKDQANKDKG